MTKDEISEILKYHAAWINYINSGGRMNLRDAGVGDVYLRSVYLRDVHHVIALGQPNGWWAFAYLCEDDIWVRVGCHTKSLSDARAYWAGKDDRQEVLAALDYAEAIARLRGWKFRSSAD